MNTMKVYKNLSHTGKVAGAVLGAAAITECIFLGSRTLISDFESLGKYIGEVKNPTVYKVKTGRFKKAFNVRKSFKPGENMYVPMPADSVAVNKKPFKVSGDKILRKEV